MKGIILAGGKGSRLYPLTCATSKQLLPLYDKPMVYYPLTTLMQAGIREILLITTSDELSRYRKLLGNGEQWGIALSYAIQEEPRGIAEAFLIGEEFLKSESVALILGDNFFYGESLPSLLKKCALLESGAILFGYQMRDPSPYGVLDLDQEGNVRDLIEKPLNPPSSYAIPGLYFYDSAVSSFAKQLRPSARGELEITDLHRLYLERDSLRIRLFDKGIAWLDTGTPDAIQLATSYIEALQKRQGILIGSPEETAYQMGFIDREEFASLVRRMPEGFYKRALSEASER